MAKKATEGEQRFGAALRRARHAAGYTQTQAGAQLHCSQSKIQKIESGQRVTDQEVATLLDFYGAPAETRREVGELRTLPAPGAPAGTAPSRQFLDFKALEERADCAEILACHLEGLPVALQSDPYILAQYRLAGDQTSEIRVLDERNTRRKVFSRNNPPRCQIILSESCMLRVPGGSVEIRREQASSLLTLIDEYEHLSLRVLLFDAAVSHFNVGMKLLKFAAGGPRPAVYVPYGRYGRLFRDKAEVVEFEDYWTTLHEASLSEEESRKYLNNLAH